MHDERLETPALRLIRNAELMSPAPLGRGDVLLAHGRILAIGHGLSPRDVGASVEVIDANGHLLCPGLVDSLVHFGGGGGEGGFATRMPPLSADAALAGGVTIRVPHEQGYRYREGCIFSKSGRMSTFDASADGVVFGNGLGLVLLKRLDAAIADGDNIHAVIKGSAVTNDGRGNQPNPTTDQ